jgi:hypothetical protein
MKLSEKITAAIKGFYNNYTHPNASKELPTKPLGEYNFDMLPNIMPLDSAVELLAYISDGNTLICPDDGMPYVPGEKMREAAQRTLEIITNKFEYARKNGSSKKEIL